MNLDREKQRHEEVEAECRIADKTGGAHVDKCQWKAQRTNNRPNTYQYDNVFPSPNRDAPMVRL